MKNLLNKELTGFWDKLCAVLIVLLFCYGITFIVYSCIQDIKRTGIKNIIMPFWEGE
jgi:hypothetical protein